MKQDSHEISVDALGMHDKDGNWSFVAINMDIWGHGASEKEAYDQMVDAVSEQVTFALFKNDMSLIDFPAEDKYQKLYKMAKLEAFYGSLSNAEPKKSKSSTKDIIAAVIFPSMLNTNMDNAFA